MRENIAFVQVCSGLHLGSNTFPSNRNIDPNRIGATRTHRQFLDAEVSPLVEKGRRRVCLWCRLGYLASELQPDGIIPMDAWVLAKNTAPWLRHSTEGDFRADTQAWLRDHKQYTGLELIDYIGSPFSANMVSAAEESPTDFADLANISVAQYKRCGTKNNPTGIVFDKATGAKQNDPQFGLLVSALQAFGYAGAEGSLAPESDMLKTIAPVAWWVLGDELGGPPDQSIMATGGAALKYQNNRAVIEKILQQPEDVQREIVLIVTAGPRNEQDRMAWLDGFREWRRQKGVTICANDRDLAYIER